jgi:hypothetical protein
MTSKRVYKSHEFDAIRTVVRSAFLRCRETNSLCENDDFSFLDGVPYLEILGTLYQGDTESESSVHNAFFPSSVPRKRKMGTDQSNIIFDKIPLVSRCYEESLMREVVSVDEIPCAMGSKCECMFIDKQRPFVCVRFQLPNFECDPKITTINKDIVLCVICIRKITKRLFYDLVFKGAVPLKVIQLYGNIFGVSGEYDINSALICPVSGPQQSLPVPVVSHERNKYKTKLVNNHIHLEQVRVDVRGF